MDWVNPPLPRENGIPLQGIYWLRLCNLIQSKKKKKRRYFSHCPWCMLSQDLNHNTGYWNNIHVIMNSLRRHFFFWFSGGIQVETWDQRDCRSLCYDVYRSGSFGSMTLACCLKWQTGAVLCLHCWVRIAIGATAESLSEKGNELQVRSSISTVHTWQSPRYKNVSATPTSIHVKHRRPVTSHLPWDVIIFSDEELPSMLNLSVLAIYGRAETDFKTSKKNPKWSPFWTQIILITSYFNCASWLFHGLPVRFLYRPCRQHTQCLHKSSSIGCYWHQLAVLPPSIRRQKGWWNINSTCPRPRRCVFVLL